MQPTKDQENYTQLSLDLGLDEETYKKIKDADKEREPEHPYNWTIPLEEIKDGLNSGFTSHSMLIGTPILCSSKSLVNWDEDKGSIWEDEYRDSSARAITHNKFIYLNSLDAEEIEKEKNNNPLLRYVINYFYYNPKESPNDKKEILKNLTEFRHPKKWIYDSITNKETIEELTPLELATSVYHRPYITIKDYWTLCFKPIFKKVFTKDGLKELKKLYDNVKPNTGTYITRTIEEDVFKELIEFNQVYYNSPELKNYKDFIESRLKALNTALEEDTKAYNTKLLEIETYLKEFNTTIEKVKEAIASKEGSSYQDLYIRDRELLRYYLAKRNAEELLKRELTEDEERELEFNRHYGDRIEKEEYNYINSIFNSERGTLENFYLELLKLGKLGEIKGFREVSINTNKQILEKANKPKTREGKLNNILEHLLQPQYFYRNDRESALLEIYQKGEIAQQDNSTTDAIKYYGINTHKATKKALEEYYKALERKAIIEPIIKDYEAKVRELKIIGAEDPEIKSYTDKLEPLKVELEELESIIKTFYVYKEGTAEEKILELRLTGTDLNGAKIVRDSNYIGYQAKDLKIVYPYSFSVETRDAMDKTDIRKDYDTLIFMTKTNEELLQAYFTLILAKIPLANKNVITFSYDELCEALKLPTDTKDKRKESYTTIRQLSALLGELKISGKYAINKAKGLTKSLERTRIGIFRNDSKDKTIYITLEAVYYSIFKYMTSYITPNLEQRNQLSLTGANYYDYIVKTAKQTETYKKAHIIPLATFRDMNPNTNKGASKQNFSSQNVEPVYNDLKDITRYTDFEIEDLLDVLKIANENQLQAKKIKINKKKK